MIEGAEPGGIEMTPAQIAAGELRADLCQLAQTFSFPKGSHFVEMLLADYNVTRKRTVAKKLTGSR
jgi:hypothetical protein